jgi:opacity protein-like surface antigen
MCTVKKFVAVVVVLAALWAIMPGPADAQQGFTSVRPGGRGGTWEFYLPLVYADDARISGQGGASVDINGDFGFGFGFGYNINDNFQLNGLFTWNSRSYDATVVTDIGTTQRYSNYMDTSSMALNAVYYFLNGDITPFVSGGVGITYVDTNVQTGPATGSCWYDPWWGYVCSSYVPTKTENDVNYSAGVGVRYDLNRQFGLQGSYNKTWIDFGKASSTPDFDTWRLDFIFRM